MIANPLIVEGGGYTVVADEVEMASRRAVAYDEMVRRAAFFNRITREEVLLRALPWVPERRPAGNGRRAECLRFDLAEPD